MLKTPTPGCQQLGQACLGYSCPTLGNPFERRSVWTQKSPGIQPLSRSEQPLTGGYECLISEVTLTGSAAGSPFYCLSLSLWLIFSIDYSWYFLRGRGGRHLSICPSSGEVEDGPFSPSKCNIVLDPVSQGEPCKRACDSEAAAGS